MIAEIVAVGSELVSGQSLDTNSQWLSRALGSLGISVHYHTSIGDDLAENIAAIRIACDRADLVTRTVACACRGAAGRHPGAGLLSLQGRGFRMHLDQ